MQTTPETGTLTIFFGETEHFTQHVHGIDLTSWDQAVMAARDTLRDKVRGGMDIIAAELRSDVRAVGDAMVRAGASLSKVYQPSEWRSDAV